VFFFLNQGMLLELAHTKTHTSTKMDEFGEIKIISDAIQNVYNSAYSGRIESPLGA
jgi:hypothetical protein